MVNPCLVLGPALNPKNTTLESKNIFKMLGDGQIKKGAPRMGNGAVNLCDVALANYKAGAMQNARGRYISAIDETNFLDMEMELLSKYGDNYLLPKKAISKWSKRKT